MLFKWIMMVVFMPVALASSPTVSCADCIGAGDISTDGTNSWQTFYAKEGSRIVLTGSSGFWEDHDRRIGDGSSWSFTAINDVEYVLNTAKGKFFATIIVNPLSSCVPEWQSEILIDGDEYEKDNVKIVAAGEELDFAVRVKGDCKNYQIEWSVDPSSAVIFANYGSLSTKGYIPDVYSGKNPAVTVALISENGERRREQTINLMVRKNSAPAIKIKVGSAIASYTSFEVSFAGSTTGKSSNEDGDYIAKIEAWLKDARGELVSHSQKTMDQEKTLPVLTLKTGPMGAYNLTARITDKYGESAEKTMTILVAEKGDSGRDKPIIDMPPDIYCVAGEPCDVSVHSADKDIFIEYFYQGKKMVKPFKFSPGNHEVLIKAYDLDENGRRKNLITITVWVHVVANEPSPEVIAVSAETKPESGDTAVKPPPPELESLPYWCVLAVFLCAVAAMRRRHSKRQKPKS